MGDNFYTTEQCSTIPVTGLQDAFERCTTNSPNLGVIIDTPATDFNEFKTTEGLDNIIPFLVERKFVYYNESSKNGTTTSSKSLFDIDTNPLIKKHYDTDYQPDDIVKNNIVNNFSNQIFDNSLLLYQNIISKLMKSQFNTSDTLLTDYYDDNITDLKKDVYNLNNNKSKQEIYYSSKYYDLNKYKSNTNILINSIFIVAFIFVISVLDNNGIISYGFIINGILLVCLVIYLLLSTSAVRDRQFSNWDKRYFDYVNDISDTV